MPHQIGFWSVFALVISSQIGSGIFILPISLAPYGIYSLISWIVSGLGAVSLALVFALLCAKMPGTGGPHVYIKHAFGNVPSFFIGWTYWVISWVSTTAIVVVSIGYLAPIFQHNLHNMNLFLEILLLAVITLINLNGIAIAGRVEFLLTLIKVVVLLVVPLISIAYFNQDNFVISEEISNLTISQILARSTLLTLWCFIGLELATTAAGSVKNSSQTIPRAIIIGTICVAVIYFVNSLAIMGIMDGNDLANSQAPYADAIKGIFPGNWNLIVSIIAFIFCAGSLNAWVLSSGQVALGLAQDKLMPKIFCKKNRAGSPFYGLITSSLGTAFLLILTSHDDFAKQVTSIIDFSVASFLFVYLACCVALLKYVIEEKSCYKICTGIIATLFCLWIIYETPINTLLTASVFTISGIPVYVLWYRNTKNSTREMND